MYEQTVGVRFIRILVILLTFIDRTIDRTFIARYVSLRIVS